MKRIPLSGLLLLAVLSLPQLAQAQDNPSDLVDTGNTAWMHISGLDQSLQGNHGYGLIHLD